METKKMDIKEKEIVRTGGGVALLLILAGFALSITAFVWGCTQSIVNSGTRKKF